MDLNEADKFVVELGNEKSLEVLMNARSKLDERIKEVRENNKSEAIKEIKEKIRLYQLSPEELFELSLPSTKAKKQRKARKTPDHFFVNPDDPSKIYKGIGPQPAWLKSMSEGQKEACKHSSREIGTS